MLDTVLIIVVVASMFGAYAIAVDSIMGWLMARGNGKGKGAGK